MKEACRAILTLDSRETVIAAKYQLENCSLAVAFVLLRYGGMKSNALVRKPVPRPQVAAAKPKLRPTVAPRAEPPTAESYARFLLSRHRHGG
jgi:hypothetical protein